MRISGISPYRYGVQNTKSAANNKKADVNFGIFKDEKAKQLVAKTYADGHYNEYLIDLYINHYDKTKVLEFSTNEEGKVQVKALISDEPYYEDTPIYPYDRTKTFDDLCAYPWRLYGLNYELCKTEWMVENGGEYPKLGWDEDKNRTGSSTNRDTWGESDSFATQRAEELAYDIIYIG